MNIVTLDFETYYDDEYTLKKMTTEAYIRDPRFEVLGVAIKRTWKTEQPYYIDGPHVAARLAEFDWSGVALLCHHAHFDGLILSHHYGIRPYAWLDTLSMARLQLGNHVRLGLDALATSFGLAAKSVPYNLFKGKHWSDLGDDVRAQLAAGAIHDCELTWQIFQKLAVNFPAEEYQVIDYTIRAFTEPQLVGDRQKLGEVWLAERDRKRNLLSDLGVTPEDLQSAAKFITLLEAEGIEVEMKDGKSGPIAALAKTDQFMKDLLEHDNPRVADLAAARLGIKSTIDQTRAERLGFMAGRGAMPVYLNYCGAHTTRWSGGDKVNWQNFKRAGGIRQAICAAFGHKLAIVDLSQIECRILNHLAGEQHVLDSFRENRDLYSEGASKFYGREITRDDKTERHLGKVLELGCGFGMGAAKLRATCRAGALGGPPIYLDDRQAEQAISTYRTGHPRVVRYWERAGQVIEYMAAGGKSFDWGPLRVEDKRIYLPNGCPLIYDTLYWDADSRNWQLKTRNGVAKLYGGKLVENVVQALARLVLSQACLRIKQQLGLLPVLLAHDEGVWVLNEDDVQDGYFDVIKEEMSREPTWLPNIPLACEGIVSDRYDKP